MCAVIEGLAPKGRWRNAWSHWVEWLTGCGVSTAEVDELLRRAFPDRPWSMADFQTLRGVVVHRVAEPDGEAAIALLRQLDADSIVTIGISPERLKEAGPRHGFLRVRYHQPRDIAAMIRAGTPGEVSVDRIGPGGDVAVVARTTIPLHKQETRATLQTKFELAVPELLVRAISGVSRGESPLEPVLESHEAETAVRPEVKPSPLHRCYRTAKLGVYGFLYFSGIFHLFRAIRQALGGNRARVLAYHRVNDIARDSLTVGVRRFAEQLLVLRRYYHFVSTQKILDWLRNGASLPPQAIAIHFDDCYRDVFTNGGRILSALGAPACAFVSTGFVDTDRQFDHDLRKCPFRMPNLRRQDLEAMAANGFEIGAHTVNHINLGSCSIEEARQEVWQSKVDLESIIRKPVRLFAFPFGRPSNMTPAVSSAIEEIGFEALFSVYGGPISRDSRRFDLSRIGMSGEFSPLEMLFEVEGLTPGAIFHTRSRTPYG